MSTLIDGMNEYALKHGGTVVTPPAPTVPTPPPAQISSHTSADQIAREYGITDQVVLLTGETPDELRIQAQRVVELRGPVLPRFAPNPGQHAISVQGETRAGSMSAGADLYKAQHSK